MASAEIPGRVVVILGSHPFPHGNASANRMLTLAMTWKAAGWRPVVLNDHPNTSAADSLPSRGSVAGIEYTNFRLAGRTRIQRLQRRGSLAPRVSSELAALGVGSEVTHIVFPSMMFTPTLRGALARSLPGAIEVVDVVERHDVTQFPRRVLDAYYLRHRFTSWYAARRADRVIVISSELAHGPFAARDALVLPPCVDVIEFQLAAKASRAGRPVRVTYFGSPGTKDDLSSLLKAVPQLSEDDRRTLSITIAGIDEADLGALPGLDPSAIDQAAEVLEVPGRLNRGALRDLLARSHFSYLVRDPSAGVARFGFPSKVPESLAAGCPLIGNLSSDLGRYLVDDENAVICDESTAGVATALGRAIDSVRDGRYESLSTAARTTAEQRLDPSCWSDALASWLRR